MKIILFAIIASLCISIVCLSSNSDKKTLEVQANVSREDNALDFSFPTTPEEITKPDCVPWTQAQADYLANAVTEAYGSMENLFGNPLHSNDINVMYCPEAVSAGQYFNTDLEIYLRDIGEDAQSPYYNLPDKSVFWHEMSHSFTVPQNFIPYDKRIYETLAQIGMLWVAKETGFDQIHIPILIGDYEFFNNPVFSTKAMAGYSVISGIGNLSYPILYTMTPVSFLKIELEYPGFIKSYIDNIFNSDAYAHSKGEYIHMGEGFTILKSTLDQIAGSRSDTGVPSVEGIDTEKWLMQNNAIIFPANYTNGTNGEYGKFGGGVYSDKNRIKVFLTHTRSRDALSTTFSSFIEESVKGLNDYSYEIYDGQGDVIYSKNNLSIGDSGYYETDITSDIETLLGDFPEGKYCLVAKEASYDLESSSCYYLSNQKSNLGVFGVAGNYNEIFAGKIKIISQSESSCQETAIVQNGEFATTNCCFRELGGKFTMSLYDDNDQLLYKRRFTKDSDDYYFLNLQSSIIIPFFNSLTVESKKFVQTTENNSLNVQFAYVDSELYGITKTFGKQHQIRYPFFNNNQYELFTLNQFGFGTKWSKIIVGQPEEIYIAKWQDDQRESNKFNIALNNVSQNSLNAELRDNLSELSMFLPVNISDGGVYSGNEIIWPLEAISPGNVKIYNFELNKID